MMQEVPEEGREFSYIHAESFATGELNHRSIALIDKGTLVVVIATQSELLKNSFKYVRS